MADRLAPGLLGERVAEQFLLVTLGDDPAAGAEVSVTIPGRAAWQVISFLVTLVADATPVQRRAALTVDNQTDTFLSVLSAQAHAASETWVYDWIEGLGYQVADGGGFRQSIGMQTLIVPPGYRVRTSTAQLQAGDNYGRPTLLVRELPERGPIAELADELVAMQKLLEDFAAAAGVVTVR